MSRMRDGVDEFSEYTEEQTGRGWRKLRRRLNGYEFLVYGSKTEDYIKAIQAEGVELKLNTMSDRKEIVTKDGTRPLSDIDDSRILARLLDFGMKNEGYMRKSMDEYAARNQYHPIKEYLDSQTWDGQAHFNTLMSKLDMSSEGATAFWRKFLIGSIAKAIDGHQNFMLVLLGAQGRGKSRLARWLCPLPNLFHEGPVNPDNKDHHIQLINSWLWEVAELDSTTKRTERAALKYFISLRNVEVRVPYGRYPINKLATASLLGTINPDGTGFLSDPTGNRRFALIHLEDIDWSYEEIDKNQLWAEIYAAYQNGEQWELTPHEREIQNEINQGHMTSSPLEELLLQYFELDPSDREHFTPTMEILEKLETLGLKGDQFRNKMELGTVLTKYGLKRTQRRIGTGRPVGYEGVWFKEKELSL